MLNHNFEKNTYSCSIDQIIFQYMLGIVCRRKFLALDLSKIITVNALYANAMYIIKSKRFLIQHKKMRYGQLLLFTTATVCGSD